MFKILVSEIFILRLSTSFNPDHHDDTKIIDKNTNLTIFEKDDPASHLSDNSQSIFIENIFNLILN